MSNASPEISQLMQDVSGYIATGWKRNLPEDVAEKGKQHLLDTLAAMISGAKLMPGEMAIHYARLQGGTAEAVVAGSDVVTSAVNAALANGMTAHADETDDSHLTSRSHLGCGVVPAALAMAEKDGRSGEDMLKAVVLGYDIGGRLTVSLGADSIYDAGHSTHSFAALFGAAAAAGALAGLNPDQARWLLSFTAQQTSGVSCWQRDGDHIEKAFDFGGMGARNGVAAATMVQAGFTGVDDVFAGPRNFFDAFSSEDANPEWLAGELGSRFEIMHTNIKKWSVGSPIQAVLDSVQALMLENSLEPDDIETVTVHMSSNESHVVDNRHMANINLQHMISVMLLDKTVTFASAHDDDRMENSAILAVKKKVILTPDPDLPRRHPIVEMKTRDGKELRHRTPAVRGTPDNPMDKQEVEDKAFDLLSGPLGESKARDLIDRIWNIEQVANMRDLRPLLMP
jgi:2-methylcitrate dehydratase PrpD